MVWEVEYTNEFGDWWVDLNEAAQNAIDRSVHLLEARGPTLPHPHSSGINGSKHGNMRELRVQVGGKPYRIFYAFDPRRAAILLIGGNKTGDDNFYDRMIPIADRIYDRHLKELVEERSGNPAFDPEAWTLLEERRHEADERHVYAFTVRTYARKLEPAPTP